MYRIPKLSSEYFQIVLNNLNMLSSLCCWYNISNVLWLSFRTIFLSVLYKASDKFNSLYESTVCLCFRHDLLLYPYVISDSALLIFYPTQSRSGPSPNLHHRLVLKKNIVTKLTQSKMKVWLAICNNNCFIRRCLEIINISIINIILYFRSSANV